MKSKTIFALVAIATLGATAVYADKGMKDADVSGDGFVSLEELKSAHSERIEEHFARMDTNADGLLSEDEMKAAKSERRGKGDKRRHGKKNPEQMIERLDTDGSGSLSMQELDGKRFSPDAAAFQTADADGSGELDATELKGMMKARHSERREGDRSYD